MPVAEHPLFQSLAEDRRPALAVSADGARLLWTNAAAARWLGREAGAADGGSVFASAHPAGGQIGRLSWTLPADGTPRLERLRFGGLGALAAQSCSCARIEIAGLGRAVLIIVLDARLPRRSAAPAPAAPVERAAADPEVETGGETAEPAAAPGSLAVAPAEPDAVGPDVVGPDAVGPEPAGADAPGPPAEAAPPAAVVPLRPRIERFIFQADDATRITRLSDEFAAALGEEVRRAVTGRPWAEVAERFGVDPEGRVARALARRETWSGVTLAWPGGEGRVAQIELAALPVFDAARSFLGFRGFGVCRVPLGFVPAVPAPDAPAEADAAAPAEPTAEQPAPAIDEPAEAALATAEIDCAAPQPAAAEPAVEKGAAGEIAAEDAAVDEAASSAEAAPSVDHGEETLPDAEPAPEPAPSGPSAELAAIPEDAPPAADAPPETAEDLPAAAPVAEASPPGTASAEPEPEPVPEPAEPVDEAAPEQPAALVATAGDDRPPLSSIEESAFRHIARALGATALGTERPMPPGPVGAPIAANDASLGNSSVGARFMPRLAAVALPRDEEASLSAQRRLLAAIVEPMPSAVLVHRSGAVLAASRAFLDLIGATDLAALPPRGADALLDAPQIGEPGGLVLLALDGRRIPVTGRMTRIDLEDGPATLVAAAPRAESEAQERLARLEGELAGARSEVAELRSILDTATDGVLLLDASGSILGANRSAEALFGYDASELEGQDLTFLLAGASHRTAIGYLDGLAESGMASVMNDGREVTGRVRQGGTIPLFMTLGRIGEGESGRFCAVLRDITSFKKAEDELVAAKLEAERASSQKSDFLAKVSHEIRTPMNAILGFSEVMMEERFGPVGNPRYKDYLRDIHASGEHVVSLVNDLLDLSKIEAGKLELDFAAVDLNEAVQGCVNLLQPQANRERIIIRTSLAASLPPVVADQRSIKQIVLNLLSNAVKFTQPGGQVIVSTLMTDLGQAVIRLRDTGVGMTEREIAAALEPFRQVPNATRSGGTGLGLPLTKALVEANRATFAIQSAQGTGTLVEVIFPPARVLAQS